MLERTSLLLPPWGPAADDPGGWTRPVVDGAGAYAGRVRTAGGPGWAWISWFRPQRLEVLETADDALLMVLIRTWGLARSWEVYDAEERHVGGVYPPALVDSDGFRRGLVRLDGPTRGVVTPPAETHLARFEAADGQALRVDFAPDSDPNPFLRMLILAAAVTVQATPLDA